MYAILELLLGQGMKAACQDLQKEPSLWSWFAGNEMVAQPASYQKHHEKDFCVLYEFSLLFLALNIYFVRCCR